MTRAKKTVSMHRGPLAVLLVAVAFGLLLSLPIGHFGGGGASAAYYYYNPSQGPAALDLQPPAATNPVGTMHTLTATVTQTGGGVGNVTVRFTVTGADNLTGNCTTDSDGHCTFTYSGPSFPGSDVIKAFADLNGNGVQDDGEPSATATKAWTFPASTAGHVNGGGEVPQAKFTLEAKSDGNTAKGTCRVVDQATGRTIKCLDVTSLVVSGNHATFYGNATDDGVQTTYRIDVVDDGEPGRGKDTFSVTTASGYSATGTLTSGNLQVH
jgi:hypothetical protein